MRARARRIVRAAAGVLALAFWADSSGCLSPGQAKSMRLQVEEILRQVEQVKLQQERTRSAFRAFEVPTAEAPVVSSPAAATLPVPAGEALYRSGYALYHRGDYAGAEKALRDFLSQGPDSSRADAARYWIGECLYGRGLYREAIGELRAVADRNPPGLWAARALYKIALAQEKLGEIPLARQTLRGLVQSFPDSDFAPLARERLKPN